MALLDEIGVAITTPLADPSVTVTSDGFLRYFVLLGVAFGYFAVIVAFTSWGARVVFTLAQKACCPRTSRPWTSGRGRPSERSPGWRR